jgi:uncharacterized protein with HEPN domain
LGEAAGQGPVKVRARHPDLPWAQMSGLRDLLAHGYFSIYSAVLRTIAVEVLPTVLPCPREGTLIEQANRLPPA